MSLHAKSKEEDAARYTKTLKSSASAREKIEAAEEIGKLGAIKKSYATEAVPYLIKELESRDAKLRAACAVALGKVDPEPADKAVEALEKILKNSKEEVPVKAAALQGLMHMGPTARSAVPTIREFAKKDADKRLLQAARAALKSIAAKN
jgi:HEAT repeat protein